MKDKVKTLAFDEDAEIDSDFFKILFMTKSQVIFTDEGGWGKASVNAAHVRYSLMNGWAL